MEKYVFEISNLKLQRCLFVVCCLLFASVVFDFICCSPPFENSSPLAGVHTEYSSQKLEADLL